jgi:NhaA family Na+:H+ antiporter
VEPSARVVVWANSPWAGSYVSFWHTPIGIRIGEFGFERSLEWFVNDVLMVIFFFVVGMEIRRELHHGELSEWRRAALPAAGAVGGMLAPALLYLAVAGAPGTRSGWGVPMATDIAFAVGLLTLLGSRVPPALRVLLLALAIIDDLGAILVIALFYSTGVELAGLLLAGAGLAGVFVLQWLGGRIKLVYVVPALVVWAGIHSAHVHPTIAGVLIGFATPVRAWLGPDGFLAGVQHELNCLQRGRGPVAFHDLYVSLRRVSVARREAVSPADGLIEGLHPWVAFGIMPLFALANAGVSLGGAPLDAEATRIIAGVTLGLLLGKPLGILLACWASVRVGIAALPVGITGRHLLVLGIVAGVGFTMALFIAQLAFPDARMLAAAKLGVLGASAAAGVLGLVLGRLLLSSELAAGAALTADEAECSTER